MFIQFGIVNLKYLFIFLTPILWKIDNFLGDKYYDNKFYDVFIDFLSLTLCGTIHLLIIFLSKSEVKRISSKKIENKDGNINSLKAQLIETINLEKEEQLRREKKKKILYILFLTSLEMSAALIHAFFKKNRILQFNFSLLVILELINLIIFSLIFLNYTLYRHQYISFILFLICHFIFFMQSVENLDITILEFIKSFLYYYSYEKLYCLYDIFGKKYLNKFMDTIYLLLFKIGITGLIPLLLYDGILYAIGVDDSYHGIFRTLIDNFKIVDILRDLFFAMIMHIGLWLTINHFSPCHYIIMDIFENFLEILYIEIKNKEEENNFSTKQLNTFYILYPILIFDTLVFNEILILKFCGLHENTKIYIMEREKLEIKRRQSNSITDSDEDSSDDDSEYKIKKKKKEGKIVYIDDKQLLILDKK